MCAKTAIGIKHNAPLTCLSESAAFPTCRENLCEPMDGIEIVIGKQLYCFA